MAPRLILASGSPQRTAILQQVGIPHEVRVPGVQEVMQGHPESVVVQNAVRKAAAVAAAEPQQLVLGVDTVVWCGGMIYGKPADADAARRTLQALSGQRHQVISGICLARAGEGRTAHACTTVQFRSLETAMVEWYLASDEWRERAGAYAIQGRGAALVRAIDGDYLNVVGLPLQTLLALEPKLLR